LRCQDKSVCVEDPLSLTIASLRCRRVDFGQTNIYRAVLRGASRSPKRMKKPAFRKRADGT
jgi:hypothetical protein